MDEDIKKYIQQEIDRAFKFPKSKLGDTPIDAYQFTNRRYVNLSGTTVNRPNASVATVGQQYFFTQLSKPGFFDGTKWRDGTASVIA